MIKIVIYKHIVMYINIKFNICKVKKYTDYEQHDSVL